VLTDAERDQLTRWLRRAKTAQALAVRSKIVLACAGGLSNAEVAAQLRVTPGTVTRWRARFVAHRLEGECASLSWPETVRLDQDRGGHPAVPIEIYREDIRRRTLVVLPTEVVDGTTRSE